MEAELQKAFDDFFEAWERLAVMNEFFARVLSLEPDEIWVKLFKGARGK